MLVHALWCQPTVLNAMRGVGFSKYGWVFCCVLSEIGSADLSMHDQAWSPGHDFIQLCAPADNQVSRLPLNSFQKLCTLVQPNSRWETELIVTIALVYLAVIDCLAQKGLAGVVSRNLSAKCHRL